MKYVVQFSGSLAFVGTSQSIASRHTSKIVPPTPAPHTRVQLDSSGYSALPSPPRLMRRAVAARRTQTHTLTPSVTIPSPLAKCQTPTGYGRVVQHHQRTSSQQFYNLLYNKFATSQCQKPTSRHIKMLECGKFLSVGGEFVVQRVAELV